MRKDKDIGSAAVTTKPTTSGRNQWSTNFRSQCRAAWRGSGSVDSVPLVARRVVGAVIGRFLRDRDVMGVTFPNAG